MAQADQLTSYVLADICASNALPSISTLEFDRSRMERNEQSRYPSSMGLSISTAPFASPTTTLYSGPPPPYSHASSSTSSGPPPHSAYGSPSDQMRSSTKEEKDNFGGRRSLPSISEALGHAEPVPFPTSVSVAPPAPLTQQSLSAPSSAAGHSFTEAPAGPANPFSQPAVSPAALRESTRSEAEHARSSVATLNATEPRPRSSQIFGQPRSPRIVSAIPGMQPANLSGHMSNGHIGSPSTFAPYKSPFPFTSNTSGVPLSHAAPTSAPYRQHQPAQFEDPKRFAPSGFGQSYGESVKRHLDVFDTQMALQEIAESSVQTHDIARHWSQRAHQTPRMGYATEVLPELHDLDEMLQHSQRIMDRFAQIKEAVIAQQVALAEQRTRAAKGDYPDDDFNTMHDDYKSGGAFGGPDGKKRRGKAAPPGRCHSCNRAETPEWRRGPDGARTLCNACGLHYAKLTRKNGANKTAIAGSNLAPKRHEP